MLLSDPVTSISMVGEKRAALYKKIGIETVYDLIHYFPRSYIDFTNCSTLDTRDIGSTVTVLAKIHQKLPPVRVRGGKMIFRIIALDSSQGVFTVTFFNNKYAYQAIEINKEYIFHGKLSGSYLRPEIVSPIFMQNSPDVKMQPIYSLTSGLTNKMIASNIKTALSSLKDISATSLPSEIIANEGFLNDVSAFYDIHFPSDIKKAENARNMFILEELISLQLGMYGMKRRKKKQSPLVLKDTNYNDFVKSLPFTLTDSQINAIDSAIVDMTTQNSMNRLLQGDVGSGKTVIAAALFYLVCKNKGQAAFMAPTEILAIQHYNTLSSQLSRFGVKVSLLTGSTTAKQKRELSEQIKNGEIDIICGTHALIEKNIEFKNLCLVITDEQHRFGVSQRSMLISKGAYPHTLVMSATPIPRSLALTIYGDLDISILDALPSGRKAIKTHLIDSTIRQRAYGFLDKEIASGRQAYIVCPAVEESELEIESAVEYKEKLQKYLPHRKIGLLHGKMKSKEKDYIMQEFRDKKLDILVSTTVIEVGVDVSNATVMLIENADRFGLSQLHQLRGRVGRGDKQSYCILVSDSTTKTATERLKIMTKTTDGFEIAKFDLKQRGPGDFFGDRQHGLPPLKSAELLQDSKLVEKAQKYADIILSHDPSLSKEENLPLKNKVNSLFKKLSFSRNN